jgi:hypothetical protein
MYYYLTEVVKRRLIYELRHYYAAHPLYKKITNGIVEKYNWNERPQYGIVVMDASASKMWLSGDHFLGNIESYVMLARVNNLPGQALEWVREDTQAIHQNNNVFPSQAGIYYIDITTVDHNLRTGQFFVDPLISVKNEKVLESTGVETTATLLNLPVIDGTIFGLRNGSTPLVEGEDYTVNLTTGDIVFLGQVPFPDGDIITFDYRYPAASTGPHDFRFEQANLTAIPGVILAFGERAEAGQKQAILVNEERQVVAEEYGGKWELSLNLDIVARDPIQRNKLADLTGMFLWTILKPQWEREGLSILDVGLGGESEEPYDEVGDDYFYNASISMQIMTDWAMFVAQPLTIRTIGFGDVGGLTDEEAADVPSSLEPMVMVEFRAAQDALDQNQAKNFEKVR